ncbi:MAG: hypothetical protein LBJ18_02480 [Rickettsiales bacterium]|jgi:hypothetical protein|nr:hypothetical protein [Rickettsiales bacterium]
MKSNLEIFQDCFSRQRMRSYETLSECGLNADTMDLYLLNLDLCKELYPLLHCLEIGIRNKINESAKSFFKREDWFNCPAIKWDKIHLEQLQSASFNAKSNDEVICNLTFGFWANLFKRQYGSFLWKKVLKNIFYDNNANQFYILSRLRNINSLRNRIAHYEIIIKDKDILKIRYDEILEVLNLLLPKDLVKCFLARNKFENLFSELERKTMPPA